MQEQQARLQQIVEDLLTEAKKEGATAAEAGASQDAGLSVNVRMGDLETVEHTRDNHLGISVYFGQKKGSSSTSDFSEAAIKEAVRAACDIARFTSEDDCTGLADADMMATELPDLDLYHPWSIKSDQATEIALSCETTALEFDARVINSEGAGINTVSGIQVYGNSHGFMAGFPFSRHSISCSVISQDDSGMQRDYWYDVNRDPSLMNDAKSIGLKAAERAINRLGSKQLPTCTAPVIFRSDIAGSLLRSLTGAIRGGALYRKASFLLDQLGQPLFPEFVRIYEDPHRLKGLSSTAYDNEGVATAAKDLVTDGRLASYLLDSYSARKLGMQTTGNAGGVHNLTIESGDKDLPGLMREMGQGLLVTEMMGQGVNMVTGDYSRGAAGFWVENGEIAYPVEEITIAGNLKEMFRGVVAIGNDRDNPGSIRTGSWLIDRMTIAGN